MGTFSRENVAKYACEFSGCMFLTMFVKLAVVYNSYNHFLIGLGLGLLIYNYGYISGGHLNPSVTMALIVRNIPDFPIQERGMVLMYFVSQYLVCSVAFCINDKGHQLILTQGGIFGGMVAWFIGGDESAAVYPTMYQKPEYYEDTRRLFQAFVGEIFFTYLLTSTVIHCATDKRQAGNQFYGLCIGLTLCLGIACIGPISGCCLNTSVYLGTVIPAIITEQTKNDVQDVWIYWVGTFTGGIVAGLWFNLLNGPESQRMKHELIADVALDDLAIEESPSV